MGVTHFLGGVNVSGVPTMGISNLPGSNGNYWFVDSVTGSDGNVGSADSPLATTKQAITMATANNGDVIVWCPAHAETISAAGGITVNKAGLTFWGWGQGKQSPTFTSATSTAATFLISSANTTIGGSVNTICNIASQVTFFSVTAANVTITATHYDTSASIGALIYITTSAAANQFTANINYFGFTASVIGTSMISLVGGSNANIYVDAYGAWSTAVVNFATTAVVNCQITGLFYNYNTALTKNVVDTITGSTWTVIGYDGIGGYNFDGGSGKAVAANDAATTTTALNVPTANSSANTTVTQVVGNKTDSAVTTFGTTGSVIAYLGGLFSDIAVPSANASTNVNMRDAIGNKTDTELFTPSSTGSLAAYAKGTVDVVEKGAVSSQVGVLSTGTTIFTIAGGPIELVYIMSMCTTGADATAATLLYTTIPTGLSAVPISLASGSIANAPVNATITYAGTGSAAACVYNAGGTALLASTVAASAVIIPPGVINITIGSGPTTTGTWKHFIRYRVMGPGVTVV